MLATRARLYLVPEKATFRLPEWEMEQMRERSSQERRSLNVVVAEVIAAGLVRPPAAPRSLLECVNLMSLDAVIFGEAFAMTRLHPLRTLDGLHLGSAAVAQRELLPRGLTLRFCTADRRQAEAAERHFGAEQVDVVPPWR